MSAAKFASITSSLLARKGEAKPWQEPDKKSLAWQGRPVEHAFSPVQADVAKFVSPSPPNRAALKKCSVRMTPQEYEQLGILAVKKNCTRQQLLRGALSQLFVTMEQEYRGQCACLGQCDGTAGPCCG